MIFPYKIKVAVITDNFVVGGAEKQLTELLLLFNRNKFDLSLITLSQFEDREVLYDQLPKWLQVYKLNFHGFKDISSWVALYKTLKAIGPDVVLSNLFFSNTVVRTLKPLLGYKVIVVEHNTYIDKTRKRIFTDKLLSYFSHKIVAVSRTVADFTAKQEHIPRNKFVVIHNGVNVEKIHSTLTSLPSKDTLKQELGFKSSDKVLLNVAGLKPKKNHKLLLDGFTLFHKKQPEYKLAIVGEGSLRKKLETQAHELGLDGVVTFFGLRRDIEKFYKISDIFVSASNIEGLSIAYLEALASGLPLVSTRTAGTDEILVDGENGFFILESSVEAVVESLGNMARADLEQMALNARVKAREFDLHKTAEKYSNLIAEVHKK
jgi:glycosyltransferase involved in cell wall biosynthesis